MIYKTRDFGEIEVEESNIIDFVQPIFGFENYTKFTLIYDKEIGDQIVWLQSTEEPGLCFILFDPSSFAPYFNPVLPENTQEVIGQGNYICWTILAAKDNFMKATVNLKSPIIINENTNKAIQIILEQDYSIRQPIIREE